MLDGRVEWKRVLLADVYDLANTDGPRGRGEASIIGVEIHPDSEGVVVKVAGGERELLIPTATIKAASKIAGKP